MATQVNIRKVNDDTFVICHRAEATHSFYFREESSCRTYQSSSIYDKPSHAETPEHLLNIEIKVLVKEFGRYGNPSKLNELEFNKRYPIVHIATPDFIQERDRKEAASWLDRNDNYWRKRLADEAKLNKNQ